MQKIILNNFKIHAFSLGKLLRASPFNVGLFMNNFINKLSLRGDKVAVAIQVFEIEVRTNLRLIFLMIIIL